MEQVYDAQWAGQLDTLLNQVWLRLARGVNDRRAPGRHPTLATVDREGMPQARTVVLRSAEPSDGVLTIYSDRRADKVEQVLNHPHATVHIWDNIAHLQMRLLTRVCVRADAAVVPIWDQLSAHARACYGFQPASGEPLAEGLAYEKWPDPSAFVVLELTVDKMDILHLGRRHRRAHYQRSDDWAGQWVVP